MRTLALLVAAAAAFGLAPLASRLSAVPGAALLLGLGIALALAASGARGVFAAAAGALGALAAAAFSPMSAPAAGAALAAFAYAERTLRVRARPAASEAPAPSSLPSPHAARMVHLALAIGAGAIAGAVAAAYVAASLPVRAVSLAVAAVLLALPLLIEADDPLAHALALAADDVRDPARATLREAVDLRRAAAEIPLARATARTVRATWSSLARLAEARVRLERSLTAPRTEEPRGPGAPYRTTGPRVVVERLDARLAEHVAALSQAYAAVDAARAAEISLDDTALRSAEAVGESLDHVSKAIIDEG